PSPGKSDSFIFAFCLPEPAPIAPSARPLFSCAPPQKSFFSGEPPLAQACSRASRLSRKQLEQRGRGKAHSQAANVPAGVVSLPPRLVFLPFRDFITCKLDIKFRTRPEASPLHL